MNLNDYLFEVLDVLDELAITREKRKDLIHETENKLFQVPGVTSEKGEFIIDFVSKHSLMRDYIDILNLMISEIVKEGIDRVIEELKIFDSKQDSNIYFYSIEKLIENSNGNTFETISSIIPKNYVMSNTKIANQLTKDFLNNGLIEFETAKKNSGKEAPVYAYLEFDNDNVNLPKNYTPYDREVFNAVCSLYDAGNNFIWPEQIYRTMTGQTNSDRVSPQAVAIINESLIKQMLSLIEIDYTAQAKLYKKDKSLDSYRIKGNMLYLKEHTAVINGQTITGFNVLEKPILYEYSQRVRSTDNGQVITVKIDLLNTKKAISNTPDNIVIRAYIVKRIEEMKNPKNHLNNKILYNTIFEECQIDTSNKVIKKRHRDAIKKILDCFIEKKYIKAYNETSKGKVLDGVEIIY